MLIAISCCCKALKFCPVRKVYERCRHLKSAKLAATGPLDLNIVMELLDLVLPFMFISIGITSISFVILVDDNSRLKETGIKATGIIFKQEHETRSRSGETTTLKDKITVRFLTMQHEWITQEINQNFRIYYSHQYKDGEEVVLYYDEKEPSNFYVDSKQSPALGKVIAVVTGLIFIIIGSIQYLTT